MSEVFGSHLQPSQEDPLPHVFAAGQVVKRREQFQVVHYSLTEAFNKLNRAFYTMGSVHNFQLDPAVMDQFFSLQQKLAIGLKETREVLEAFDHIMRAEPDPGNG